MSRIEVLGSQLSEIRREQSFSSSCWYAWASFCCTLLISRVSFFTFCSL